MKKIDCRIFKSRIITNNSTEGETIEMKVRRITIEKEPISDSAPIIFTEKKDGVRPEYDIRTDRFDIAMEAMEKVGKIAASEKAKRIEAQEILKKSKEENKEL